MSRARQLALEDRMQDAFDELSREDEGGLHGDSVVVLFVSDPDGFPWPRIPKCFFPVQRCVVTGDEKTGTAAILTPVGNVFWAANVGYGIPPDPATPATNYAVADECGGRWCFVWNG